MDVPQEFTVFVAVADRYCAAIEELEDDPPERTQFLTAVRLHLVDLVAAALRLPEVEPATEDDLPGITHARCTGVFAALKRQLGELDTYSTIFEPYDENFEAEASLGSLADDLADIWRDLRDGLDALASGAAWTDVSWEWRFGWETHWGKHAVEALRALQAVRDRAPG